ncbi:hypothetical protein NP233_g5083 [Leucocoprinus birnbaumii]|uniref:Uncharacterized protein n=1 Tax=Leucocoprinus birnbaumii TaxID=56174 RepID=A0AAD5YS83_9AGAR|nr:hypothetical protein NP233_g5083 [Leucocoprinus birnbaumii]
MIGAFDFTIKNNTMIDITVVRPDANNVVIEAGALSGAFSITGTYDLRALGMGGYPVNMCQITLSPTSALQITPQELNFDGASFTVFVNMTEWEC